MKDRNLLQYIVITLKGMAMGIAELVPGVSGGTIAFVAGIYEEFISTINNVNLKTFRLLRTKGFKDFWLALNGNFLITLLLGMAISILSFTKIIRWLLENEPILLWSFFFGLVFASVIIVAQAITKWTMATIILLTIGAIGAYFITTLPPSASSDSLPFIFFSGAIAICAMILPGISGSFILVLLGTYKTVIDAVDEKNLKILITMALGMFFGVLSFAKILKWMFDNHKNITLAILTGFILGSLNKIWPWKTAIETRAIGEKIIQINESVSPYVYDGDPQLMFAIIAAISGFCFIFILEKVASKK